MRETYSVNGEDMGVEELARLVVERLAVRLGVRHAQHVHVGERALPNRLVDLAQPIHRDHAADDVLQLGPRLVEHDLAWLERHFRGSLSLSLSLSLTLSLP